MTLETIQTVNQIFTEIDRGSTADPTKDVGHLGWQGTFPFSATPKADDVGVVLTLRARSRTGSCYAWVHLGREVAKQKNLTDLITPWAVHPQPLPTSLHYSALCLRFFFFWRGPFFFVFFFFYWICCNTFVFMFLVCRKAWDLRSLIRDWTCSCCIEEVLISWTTRESPA